MIRVCFHLHVVSWRSHHRTLCQGLLLARLARWFTLARSTSMMLARKKKQEKNQRGSQLNDYVPLSLVPSGPPQNINCQSRSPNSLLLEWSKPAREERNGIIRGYWLQYYPRTLWYGKSSHHYLILFPNSQSSVPVCNVLQAAVDADAVFPRAMTEAQSSSGSLPPSLL